MEEFNKTDIENINEIIEELEENGDNIRGELISGLEQLIYNDDGSKLTIFLENYKDLHEVLIDIINFDYGIENYEGEEKTNKLKKIATAIGVASCFCINPIAGAIITLFASGIKNYKLDYNDKKFLESLIEELNGN